MKQKFKYFMLVIFAMMVFSGCGSSEKSATELIEKAQEEMTEITSFQAEVDMNVKMQMGEEEIATVTTADITAFVKPLKMKLDVSSSMENSGTPETIIQMYVQEKENEITSFVNAGTGWYSQQMQGENFGQYRIYDNIIHYLATIDNPKDKGTEKIGDTSTVRVEGTLKGETMEKIIQESGVLSSVQSVGISEEELHEMYAEINGLPITLWIGDDGLVYQYETDLSELMQIIMDKTIELIGFDTSGDGMNVLVQEANISMKCSEFNEVENFEIPAEVLEVNQ